MTKYDINSDKQPFFKLAPVSIGIGASLWICAILLAIFVLYSGRYPTQIEKTLMILFMASGLVLIIVGKVQALNAIDRYKKHLALIGGNRIISIEQLASASQTEYHTLIKDLKIMINIGYIGKAYIDYDKKELIVTDGNATA